MRKPYRLSWKELQALRRDPMPFAQSALDLMRHCRAMPRLHAHQFEAILHHL